MKQDRNEIPEVQVYKLVIRYRRRPGSDRRFDWVCTLPDFTPNGQPLGMGSTAGKAFEDFKQQYERWVKGESING